MTYNELKLAIYESYDNKEIIENEKQVLMESLKDKFNKNITLSDKFEDELKTLDMTDHEYTHDMNKIPDLANSEDYEKICKILLTFKWKIKNIQDYNKDDKSIVKASNRLLKYTDSQLKKYIKK